MEPIQVPEDLTTLSDEDLSGLGQEIRERVESLADEARASDEVLGQVEGLIGSFDRINDELTTREIAAQERDARLSAAMERFAAPETAEVEEEEDEAPEEDEAVEAVEADTAEAAIEEEVAIEAAADEVEEAATEEVEEAATDTESVVEAATAELADDTEQFNTESQEVTQVADTPRRPTVSRLRERRPEAHAPRSEEQAPSTFQVAGAVEGQKIDVKAVAAAIADKNTRFGNVPSGTHDRISVGNATIDFGDRVLSNDPFTNFSLLRQVRNEQRQVREAATSLVASGGVCAPLEPSYDFFRLAEEQDPVERFLPLVGAPRGGIRFITPPDFRDAADGVRITTEAEDQAGYGDPPPEGGVLPKPCVRVECPPIEECRVDAVSRCVLFGNLNYRVFPEQVEAFLGDLSVIFTETKEVLYLDAIDAASTPVTVTGAYGASRSVVDQLLRSAANYRRRHHMDRTSTLQVLLPSWVIEFLKVDMVNDHSLGLSHIDADMGEITRFFAQANLDVGFYYDSASGAGQGFNGAQGAGQLNEWPASVVSYMFAPGTFVRLDAGTLDVGLVRDSILNGTNDLQLFAEQWVQVCQVGLESLRIEHTLCPDGTAPEPVTPLICGGGSD